MPGFAALDFETANDSRDSACAIAIVKVIDGRIAGKFHRLIRPPQREFIYTHLHGITWNHVAREQTFGEIWPEAKAAMDGADFVAAHNASFDRGVFHACCQSAGIRPPRLRFVCTVDLARQCWKIYPTKLNLVCRRLGIELEHHEPLSDAMACAEIVLQAQKTGARMV